MSTSYRVNYGGQFVNGREYYTTRFWCDGHVAYCAQPKNRTPNNGVYTKRYWYNDAIAAVLYYGYGGPGWDYAYSHGWWPKNNYDGSWMSGDDYYAATHVLVSYLYGGWGDALHRTSQSYKNWATNNLFGWVLTNLRNNAYQVPEAFKRSVYWVDAGWNTDNGKQGQDFVSFNWVNAGGIQINKTDGITGQPLNGITFNIYNSDQSGNTYGYVTSITTDANGNAATRINQLPVGWYILKETNPPANCKAVTSYPAYVDTNFMYSFKQSINGSIRGPYGRMMFENTATVDVEFTKEWYGKSASSTQIELLRNGVPTGDRRTLTSDGNISWSKWGFYNLPKYDSAKRDYVYTVREVGVNGNKITLDGTKYQVSQSGNTIRNVELKDISVTKEWDDKDNKYGLRPDSVKAKLMRLSTAGKTVEIDSQILSADNDWTYTWTDLPTASTSGEYYFYSIEEESGTTTSTIYSSFYNASKNALINTLNTVDIPVVKTWASGKELPYSVKLQLMNGDTVVDEATITADENGDWKYTFEGVPEFDKQGNKIEYTVKDDIAGYVNIFKKEIDEQTGNDVCHLMNVSTETIDVPVSKKWTEYVTPPTAHPNSIVAILYANGQPTGKTLTISASDGWKGEFKELPRYNLTTGKEIIYTVGEQPVDGYSWNITKDDNGQFEIENMFGSTSVKVSKAWTNENGNISRRPASVTVKLIGDGVETGKTLILNSAGNWTGTFTNLPKYNAQGNEIAYTVSEVPVGFYMSSISGDQETGYTITNKYAENETSVSVAKAWDDKDDEAGLRHSEVVAVLKQVKHNGAQKLGITTNPSTVLKRTYVNVADKRVYMRIADTSGGRYNVSLSGVPWTAIGTLSTNDSVYGEGFNKLSQSTNNPLDSNGCVLVDLSNDSPNTYIFPLFQLGGITNSPFTVCFTSGIYNLDISQWNPTHYEVQWPRVNGLSYYFANAYDANYNKYTQYGFPDTLYIDANNNGVLGYQFTAQNNEWGEPSATRTLSGYEKTSVSYPTAFAKVISSTSQWANSTRTNRSFTATGKATTTTDGKAAHEIILYDPAGGSSFYPTATANARHAISFYYTASADTTVTVKMQTQTGYWNEGYDFATFTAKAGTHYYTLTQNATNAKSGTVRLDFLDGSGTNLNGNVDDLSFWNTAAGTTTTDTGKTLTLNASNNWSGSFTDLPRFDSATNAPIEYTVEEKAVEGYTPSIKMTGSASAYTQNELKQNPYYSYNITNKLGDLRDIPVTKIWDDSDNLMKKRPDSIAVSLYRNGTATGDTLTLSEDNNWTATFYNLRAKDDTGTLYDYTVREDTVPGYEPAVITGSQDSGYTVTNSMPLTTVPVTKVWNDIDNAFSTRPGSVTVHLYADDADTGKQTMLSDENNWTYTFDNLPVLGDDGHTISYTVKEDDVDKYNCSITGNASNYIVTNTLEKMSIPVTKVWDTDQRDIPNAVTVILYRNDVEIARQDITEEDNWQCTFENLDVYDASGAEYIYRVDEVDVPNFDKSISGSATTGFTITNTERLDIPVYKQWDDFNDIDELRPDEVTVNLYAEGADEDNNLRTITWVNWNGMHLRSIMAYDIPSASVYESECSEAPIRASDGTYSYTFAGWEDAVIDEQGNVTYRAKYTPVPLGGVTGPVTPPVSPEPVIGIEIDNPEIPLSLDIPADTVSNTLSSRAGTNKSLVSSVKLSADNDWSHVFTDLPKYNSAGEKITYTVEEVPVDSYTTDIAGSALNGFTITNSHQIYYTSMSVNKVWDDGNNVDNIRPESVTVRLMQDGTEYATKVLDESNGWSWTFTKLPIRDDKTGVSYTYTIEEDVVDGYEAYYAQSLSLDYTITNRHIPQKRNISVEKMWSLTDGDVDIPDEITVNLLQDGTVCDTATITPDENGQWQHTFESWDILDPSDNHEYVYTVEEEAIPHFAPIYAGDMENGFVIVNNYMLASIDIEGIKTWSGDIPANRPDYITVQLYADNELIDEQQVRPSLDGIWGFSFGNHPLVNEETGKEIVYTVQELPVAGYEAEYGFTDDGDYKINNRATKTISVKKEWDDNDNKNGSRPRDVSVELLATRFTNSSALHWVDNSASTDEEGNGVVNPYAIGYQFNLEASSDFVGELKCNGTVRTAIVKVRTKDGKILSSNRVDVNGLTEPVAFTIGDIPDGSYLLVEDEAGNSIKDKVVSLLIHDSKTSTNVVKTMTLFAANNWAGSFNDLMIRDNKGFLLSYTVKEAPCYGYESTLSGNETSGFVITNKEKDEIEVEKTWLGTALDPAYNVSKPSSVDLILVANDTPTDKKITLTEENGWTGAFRDIAWRDADGNEIEYSIEEAPVANWMTARIDNNIRSDYSVTVVNVPAFKARFSKSWVGDSAHTDQRPDSVEVSLLRTVEDTTKITGDFEQWGATMSTSLNKFSEMYEMPDEAEYAFENRADEPAYVKLTFRQGNSEVFSHIVTIEPNQTTTGSIDIASLDDSKTTTVTASDVNTGRGAIESVAESDAVDGEITLEGTVAVEETAIPESNEWQAEGDDYPLVDIRGNELSYDATETTMVPNYSSSVSGDIANGYTITNTYGKMDIPVEKVWVDLDDKDGLRPDSVDVELLANGEKTGNILTLKASEGWLGWFTMLDINDEDGNPIDYTIEEITQVEGYTTNIAEDGEDGFIVTNYHDPKTSITITKIWDDTDNVKKERPSSLKVHLMNGNVEVAVAEITGSTNTWSYTFEDLPYLDNGKPIEYTVIEDEVDDYIQTSMVKMDNGYVITNWTAAPLIELPFSGGIGIWIIVLAGLGFASIAFGLQVRRQDKLMALIRRNQASGKTKDRQSK